MELNGKPWVFDDFNRAYLTRLLESYADRLLGWSKRLHKIDDVDDLKEMLAFFDELSKNSATWKDALVIDDERESNAPSDPETNQQQPERQLRPELQKLVDDSLEEFREKLKETLDVL